MRIAAVAAVLFVCACGGSQDLTSSNAQSPIEREQWDVGKGPPPQMAASADPDELGQLAKVSAAAANSPNGTVTICHIPPGNPAKAHEITVGAPAARAHIVNHRDRVGGCCVEAGEPCTTSSDCCQDQAALACRVDPSSPTGGSCGGIG
jgi:hypothetical protein